MTNPPVHIAIIPDGNRRWAQQKNLPALAGRQEGARTFERIMEAALELDIRALTLWGISASNITNRSKEEISFLFALFQKEFTRLLKNKKIEEYDVRVRIFGRWEEFFPEPVKKVMREAEEHTKGHTARALTFLMAYSGKEEMLSAIRDIAKAKARNASFAISEQTVKDHLWLKDLPPADLIIRTGGEPHWSEGFMMWDTSDAQLYFTETLWPDFSPEEFTRAVEKYGNTTRRFGK